MESFDPSSHGLESHYNTKAQYKIRRLILEDWKQSEAKLPTYMNLLALYIIPDGLPDGWLKKLSHQTMSKMLKSISTPRYEFWASLHLYLNKKYGTINIKQFNEVTQLGAALKGFGKHRTSIEGEYQLDEHTVAKFSSKDGYTHLVLIQHHQSDEPFADMVYTIYEGAGIGQSEKLIGLLRNLGDRHLRTYEQDTSNLEPLGDQDLQNRLTEVVNG